VVKHSPSKCKAKKNTSKESNMKASFLSEGSVQALAKFSVTVVAFRYPAQPALVSNVGDGLSCVSQRIIC
jgi:hypothetical protein